MKKLIQILIFITLFFLWINYTNAAINLIVSPIKYEIKWNTWTTITKTAKIKNPWDETVHITMWKSDFVPNWENWIPKFVRKSELVYPDQQLSERITISTWSFDLAPWETKQISFDINIPDNATPGGHYWAIFFKNNNSETWDWNKVWINVDYWVLILLEVEWKIIVDAEIKDPIINTPTYSNGWWWWAPKLIKDYCPNWDFSPSYYDKTCEAIPETNTWDITESNSWETNESNTWNLEDNTTTDKDSNTPDNTDNFQVDFKIPIDNKWNTHIKPTWKIILKDENWKVIKGIWKEIITNDKWAIIWERIVDYIPINDIWWVVIPWSSRIFDSQWKWFPYRDYDESWNPIIKYWTPTEYYTRQNLWKTRILMPWEKVEERTVNKNIQAEFKIKYKWKDWEDIEYNSAKEFPVSYKEKYVTINWYILCPIIWLLVFIIILILIYLSKRTKCIKCGKTIKKDMKVCPYCWAKQKKKKN